SPGIERPLRWPEHWRRFIGRRTRVRAGSVPGRHQYEILAVPDDDRVVLRREDGSEITLAFDDVLDATLVADQELFGKHRT
ncbi:MAG TPA: hypothetical protein VD930_05735, partial [Gemmatimonadales bacterium]|nr:hypothetical protein [Gemmatimonadales bacterium]